MSTIIGKRRALGRGLAALIPEAASPSSASSSPAAGDGGGNGGASSHGNGSAAVGVRSDGLFVVAIEEVHPGPHQPRKTFDDERLDELAESIRTQGIIQPLVVRRSPSGSGFELIAGERRWRAAQRAGLHEVPVVVREVAERQAFEMALVENLQRADLNPIEEAEGYQRLFAEFGYTQEALADRVGKDRSTVANALRLLRLPPAVRELVVGGRLAMGHARALLGLDSDASIDRLARQTVARDLSVRQVEALVRKERQDASDAAPAKPTPEPPSPAARDLTLRLERSLGTRVKLVQLDPTRGHLEIQYHSLDQLDGILDKILGPGPA
jgi:ParB family chromosome partitioning protein